MRHGEMTEAEAEVHPHRHILTRALGVGPGVDVDLWELRVRSGDRPRSVQRRPHQRGQHRTAR